MQRRQKPLNKTRRKCPSRKIRFDSEYEAERSINHHVDPDKPYRPTRAYYCRECNGYHLTSRSYDPESFCGECGVRAEERHELSCSKVSPEEFFARTGGRMPKQEGKP